MSPIEPTTAAPKQTKELWTRVVSSLVLAALALALTWAGVWPFAVLVGLGGALVAWEWSRMVRKEGDDAPAGAHIVVVILSVVLAALDLAALAVILLAVGTLLVGFLSSGRRPLLSALGVGYAGLPAAGLVWLRADEGPALAAVLFVFLIVWTTDIAAYAAGRTLGGPKLAPSISPNKTWSGLAGGVGTSVMAGALFAGLASVGTPGRLALIAGLLAIAAQAGDLLESGMKRRFGLKDTSTLIPGHGGIMDRVDGLVAVVLVAGLYCLAVNVDLPARALLVGR